MKNKTTLRRWQERRGREAGYKEVYRHVQRIGNERISVAFEYNLPELGFLGGSAGKKFACNAGDLGSIPGLGRSPGEGKGYLLQYSSLENSTDCIVHRVAVSDRTERLSLSLP